MLLQIKKISKKYGLQTVLDGVDFVVAENQKIAVVGRNGAGKSTLFRIIIDQEKADSGEICIFENTRIGYLKQEDDFDENDIVVDYLVRESKKEIWQCAKMAARFYLKEKELNSKILDLSGGYQMRVKLSLMLLKDPNLLLLDEPTNYLDMSTMILLENFLMDYSGAFMVISHDRKFIENISSETLEIENSKLSYFPGKLCDFEKAKKEKHEFVTKFNKKQDSRIKHLQNFVDRFGAQATKAKQAQAKLKEISRIEKMEVSANLKHVKIRVKDVGEPHGLAIRVDDLSIGYGEKIISNNISIDVEKGEHIAVLGNNGEGKTTFLKTIAGEIPKLGGHFRWMPNTKVAYYAQHVTSKMDPRESVEEYLQNSSQGQKSKEEIMRIAGNFLFSEDDMSKNISVLSGGEKARLCLAGILLNDYNVLLFDEPNNHLDFTTVELLARALKATKATVLFISHDRTFVEIVADDIIEVSSGRIKRFMGTYDDYIDKITEGFSLKQENKDVLDVNIDKEYKKMKYAREKEIKKEISKIEKLLKERNSRKEEILKIIETDYKNYSCKLTEELKDIEKEILEYEEKWLEVHDSLER